ncbi:hypothetical protein ACHQM5_003564 [Ranunculus cassubicifolius]
MVATSKFKLEKATIDGYIKFRENPKASNFNKVILTKIVSIHGIPMKWAADKKKEEIIEMLSSIDLRDPFRSTLKENISSSAALSLTEVVRYLDFLQWNECPVQSLVTVVAAMEKVSKDNTADFGSMSKIKKGNLKRKWTSITEKLDTVVSVSACDHTPPDSSCGSAASGVCC